MKLKKKSVKPVKEPEVKKEKGVNKLPSDSYKPEFEPLELLVREYNSYKDASKTIKEYMCFSVIRFGEDGLPYVFVSTRQESKDPDIYSGYLKGKTIKFPLEMLYSVMEQFDTLSEECDNRGIE